jgi:hypothetical protein
VTGLEAMRDTLAYNLLDRAGVARLAHVEKDTVKKWELRYADGPLPPPVPVVRLDSGPIWLLAEWVDWLVRTRRMDPPDEWPARSEAPEDRDGV